MPVDATAAAMMVDRLMLDLFCLREWYTILERELDNHDFTGAAATGRIILSETSELCATLGRFAS